MMVSEFFKVVESWPEYSVGLETLINKKREYYYDSRYEANLHLNEETRNHNYFQNFFSHRFKMEVVYGIKELDGNSFRPLQEKTIPLTRYQSIREKKESLMRQALEKLSLEEREALGIL